MGMDGLSIANTGVVKESTSAEYANKTEQSISADPTADNQRVQGLGVNPRVRRKDEEEEESSKKKHNDTFQDGFVDETPEEVPDEEPEFEIEDFEKSNKDFYVKLNAKDDIIELYDSATDKLIETISGNELGELVQKLNMASGIFINRKV